MRELVSTAGACAGARKRPLVYSERNKNLKIEFDLPDAPDYPTAGTPLLLVLELGLRRFRYMLLMPGDPGYAEMRKLGRKRTPEQRARMSRAQQFRWELKRLDDELREMEHAVELKRAEELKHAIVRAET